MKPEEPVAPDRPPRALAAARGAEPSGSRALRASRPRSPQAEPSRRPQPGRARRRRYLQHPPGGKLTGGPEPLSSEARSALGSRCAQRPRLERADRAGGAARRSPLASLQPGSLPPFFPPGSRRRRPMRAAARSRL